MTALARPLPLGARSTARSHVGHVRAINEDRVFDWPAGGVWAIADGMGGHRGGDEAAQSVVDALRLLTPEDAARPAAVLGALTAANAAVRARNIARGESAGATVVALSRYGDAAHVAWAGDSRLYRLRAGMLVPMTRDHSVVQELVDARLLTAAAAAQHPQANVITRALGVDADCNIECRLIDVAPGDRFLLCSDGLSRTLEPLPLPDSLDAAADALMAAALERDGSDNISLVLVDP